VVQIVDARNPLLFRSVDLEKWVLELGKRILLLVNKADFLTEEQREFWVAFFKNEGINFVFFSAKVAEEEEEEKIRKPVDPSSSKIFTRSEILELFIQECKKVQSNPNPNQNPAEPEKYTVGMVGYPNVGKSSTINILLEEKRVAVSKTPGKTKHFQTINLTSHPITLCDCPGLVFPTFMSTRAEMVCNGLIRIAELRDVLGPINFICKKIPRSILEAMYGMMLPVPKDHEDPNRLPTAEEVLTAYGYIRGFMTRHGIPDQSRAGKFILEDFVSGKILYCQSPPNCSTEQYQPVIRNLSQFPQTSVHEVQTHGDSDSGEDSDDPAETPGDVEVDLNLGGVDLKTYELVEERNLNDHRKLETGRKHQRRQKQKLTLENQSGAYITGKKHTNYTGVHHVGNKGLPTNIKLMGRRHMALGGTAKTQTVT